MPKLEVNFPENAEEELTELMKNTKNKKLFRRAQVILSVLRGNSCLQTSKIYSYADSNLRIWLRRYEKDGIEGLKDKPKPGRDLKFTKEVESIILELLEQDPLKYKSKYPFWVCSQLALVLKKEHNVDLSSESIRLFLKKNDISITFPPKK